jgi:hypothetical protein
MADNFLQFSETLDDLTPEEATWLDRQLAEDRKGCPAFLQDYEDREPGDTDCGFQCELVDEADNRHLWLYADEAGDVGRVAHLVQAFLKRFRPDQCWSLSYAATCSKLRVGEFGGGAVFVTADEIHWQSSDGFIEQERTRFKARKTATEAQT